MAFEYNGVVYRDLEPQVRYDAEQVQLLKQADVTINENLQTINTEISGKLTKPTNPSAESAVTMLADGTVGTKPLSEIGGSKFYQHKVSISDSEGTNQVYFVTYSTKRKLDYSDYKKLSFLDCHYIKNYSTRYKVINMVMADTESGGHNFNIAYATAYPYDESTFGFHDFLSGAYTIYDTETEL